MLGRLLVGLSLLLIAVSASVEAQALDGPALSAETPLYAHGKGGTLWMSTVKEDKEATDVTRTMAFPGSASTPAVFGLLPALASPLSLDPAGSIQFNLRVGSGLVGNVGQFSTKLEAGTTLIAEAKGPANDPIVSSYKDMKLTAAPLVSSITPDMGALTWTISFAGQGTAYIQISQSGQWCNLVLPIVGGGAAATNETADQTDNATTNQTAPAGNETANQTASPSPTANATANATSASTQDTKAVAKAADEEATPAVPWAASVVLLSGAALVLRRRRA